MLGTVSVLTGILTYAASNAYRAGPEGGVSKIWWLWMLPCIGLTLIALVISAFQTLNAYRFYVMMTMPNKYIVDAMDPAVACGGSSGTVPSVLYEMCARRDLGPRMSRPGD